MLRLLNLLHVFHISSRLGSPIKWMVYGFPFKMITLYLCSVNEALVLNGMFTEELKTAFCVFNKLELL